MSRGGQMRVRNLPCRRENRTIDTRRWFRASCISPGVSKCATGLANCSNSRSAPIRTSSNGLAIWQALQPGARTAVKVASLGNGHPAVDDIVLMRYRWSEYLGCLIAVTMTRGQPAVAAQGWPAWYRSSSSRYGRGRAHAHQLLDGQSVGIELDPSQGDCDRYGGPLAYVWLPDGRNLARP